jgi:malonyl-CoA O-methyltransferase
MSAPLVNLSPANTPFQAPLAVDKSALAQQFSGAAGSYDSWATAQAEIAEQLVHRIPSALDGVPEAEPSAHAPLIVELGCGTGLLTGHLLRRYRSARLAGIDLASGMVEHCRRHFAAEPRATFLVGDVEDAGTLAGLGQLKASRDEACDDVTATPQASLIASSCVAQWFADAPATLRLWSRALAPGGRMAFACLLRGSFFELEEAYREATQTRFCGLPLPDASAVPEFFRAAGLRVRLVEEARIVAHYATPRDALRSFREIGAVFEGQPGHQTLSAAALRRLLAHYDRRRTPLGLAPVTHCVQYIVAERAR